MKIKHFILAGAMVFTGITSVTAQDLNWGVKAGVNYSNLSAEIDPDYVFGFHAGLVAEYKFSPKFALQPELLYSMEGAQADYEFREGEFFFSSEERIRLGYINLPVMAKYYVAPGFSLQAGPQVGYLISGENEYKIDSNFPDDLEITGSGTEDIKDELKKIAFGFNFGLGYDFGDRLFVQARYHVGLSDISDYDDEDEDMEVEFEKIKNQGFQVSLGYKF